MCKVQVKISATGTIKFKDVLHLTLVQDYLKQAVNNILYIVHGLTLLIMVIVKREHALIIKQNILVLMF